MIASVLGDGADRLQVAAGTGLAHCDRGDDFAGTVARQPALALVLRTQSQQILPVDIVVYGEARTVKTRARQLLVEDRVIPVVRVTAAAITLVDVDAKQPRASGREPQLTGHGAVAIPLVVIWLDLFGDKGPHHVTECVVFLGEDAPSHGGRLRFCSGSRGFCSGSRGFCSGSRGFHVAQAACGSGRYGAHCGSPS